MLEMSVVKLVFGSCGGRTMCIRLSCKSRFAKIYFKQEKWADAGKLQEKRKVCDRPEEADKLKASTQGLVSYQSKNLIVECWMDEV